jgi:hypothetical protein
MFTAFKLGFGLTEGSLIVVYIVSIVAIIASGLLKETFHKELDYIDL